MALPKETILNHSFVPKHEVLNKKETEELLKDLDVTREKLPRIKETDPIIELIGAKKGNIVKITRDSIIAGKAIYYRVVV